MIAKITAQIARARSSYQPSLLAVNVMARTLMAVPEYKNAVAGPIPAPRVYIPSKRGNTVHEHTARIVPETDATEYARIFFACTPKYLRTDAWETNIAMAPSIKKIWNQTG